MTKMVHVSIDEYQEKKLLTDGQKRWLKDYSELLEQWLDDNIAEESDWDRIYFDVIYQRNEFLAYLFYLYLKQLDFDNKFHAMCKKINEKRGHICVVIGNKRSGKTVLAYNIAEYLHDKFGEEIWWYGQPTTLPKFIKGQTIDFDKIPENTTTIIDESGVHLFNRYFQNQDQSNIIRKLAILGHTGRNLITITQCLPKDYKIFVANGLKKLSDIEYGEKIKSFNFRTHEIEECLAFPSKVKIKKKVIITTEDNEKIECSLEHKWFIMTQEVNVKRAKNLEVGDLLCCMKLTFKKIKKIEIVDCNEEMIDLDVPRLRNFILENGVISHNSASIVDVGLLRQSTSVIFTSPSFLRLRRERLIIDERINYFMPKKVSDALYFDGDSMFEISFPLPKWWKSIYSNPYSVFKRDADAYRCILKMMKETDNAGYVHDYLSTRAYLKMSLADVEFVFILASEVGIDNLLALNNDNLEFAIARGFSDITINNIIKGKKDYARYSFEQNPMLKEYWRIKINDKPELENYLRFNRNSLIISSIKHEYRTGHNIVSIIGETGSGKSLASLSLAECICALNKVAFNPENISFLPEEMMTRMPGINRHNCAILDEQVTQYGAFSGRTAGELRNMEETLRARQISFIFNGPRLHEHLNRFILEPYGIDYKSEVVKMFLYTSDKKPLGYITLSRPSRKVEEAYLMIKNRFVEGMSRRDSVITSTASRIQRFANELAKDDDYLHAPTRKAQIGIIIVKYGVGQDNAAVIQGLVDVLQQKKTKAEMFAKYPLLKGKIQ